MAQERTGHAGAEQVKPLSGGERQRFPYPIYGQYLPRGVDHSLLIASYETLKTADFPIAIDREANGQDLVQFRTRSRDSRTQRFESVMIIGLSEAARKKLAAEEKAKGKTVAPTEPKAAARKVTDELYQDFVGKKAVHDTYKDMILDYGSYTLNQERFVRELFEYGTDYDPEFVKKNVSNRMLSDVAYRVDIPYEERRGWDNMDPNDILDAFPQIDYRKLEDEAFRATDEGRAMEQAYAGASGEVLSERAHDPRIKIATDGTLITKAMIPMTRYPLIESLIAFEMQSNEGSHDFIRDDYCDLAIRGDSKELHDALVWRLTAPFPEPDPEDRFREVSREFQRKENITEKIVQEYTNFNTSPEHRELLKDDLVAILDFYTGDNDVTRRLRVEETLAQRRDYYSEDAHDAKKIISSIVKTAIASPDPELSGRAERLIEGWVSNLPAHGDEQEIADPLGMSRTEIILTLFDAMDASYSRPVLSENSRSDVFGRIARTVFGDGPMADTIEHMADLRVREMQHTWSPEVGVFRREAIKDRGFGEDESGDANAARTAFQRANAPAEVLHEEYYTVKRDLLVSMLQGMVRSGNIAEIPGAPRMFQQLVERVKFSMYKARELPEEYHKLMALAKEPSIRVEEKNVVLFHTALELGHFSEATRDQIIPVIEEMFEIALGPADNMHIEQDQFEASLSCVDRIVGENMGMFRGMDISKLAKIMEYKPGIAALYTRITEGNKLAAAADSTELITLVDDRSAMRDFEVRERMQLSTLQSYARTIRSIEEKFEDHVRMEEIRRHPHLYYQYVLQELRPFAAAMQEAVSERNDPPAEMHDLYAVLRHHLTRVFDFRDTYPVDFDVMEEGGLDSWLREGYNRMIVPSDLQYYRVVWTDGKRFMLNAMNNMPTSLLERMAEEYEGEPFGEYLANQVRGRKAWEEQIV